MGTPDEQATVEAVLDTFFAAFATGPDLDERVAALRAVLHPRVTVVRLCGEPPLVLDLEGFVAPRHALLASGRLTGFREWRTGGHVEVVGDIASWWGPYAKEWHEGGVPQTGSGHKGIHLVRDDGRWLVTSVVWDDDPPA
ncbi:DUF4440 domain-containing protein [Phycicoccus avicenniae]|uniref:DUF4440 domain-containing protein n=1 Tax=Phycicoccus avicenniae TaxID=2828860 RepID=UPI003D29956C